MNLNPLPVINTPHQILPFPVELNLTHIVIAFNQQSHNPQLQRNFIYQGIRRKFFDFHSFSLLKPDL